jgi:flavin reductase
MSDESTVDVANDFKQAMRRLTTTIGIITTRHGEERFGMTATAVCSVSTAPPAIAICINRSASLHDAVLGSAQFCVNLLSAEHHPLVFPFSGKVQGEARFEHGSWGHEATGLPYLDGSIANIFCKLDAHLEYHTHTLFIGAVERVLLGHIGDSLLWKESGFAIATGLKGISA